MSDPLTLQVHHPAGSCWRYVPLWGPCDLPMHQQGECRLFETRLAYCFWHAGLVGASSAWLHAVHAMVTAWLAVTGASLTVSCASLTTSMAFLVVTDALLAALHALLAATHNCQEWLMSLHALLGMTDALLAVTAD